MALKAVILVCLSLIAIAVPPVAASEVFFAGTATLGSAKSGLAKTWISGTGPSTAPYLGSYNNSGSADAFARFSVNQAYIVTGNDYMSSTEEKAAGSKYTFPLVVVSFCFIAPGPVTVQLKGSELAQIYLGKLNFWNDTSLKGRVGKLTGRILPVAHGEPSYTTKMISNYFADQLATYPPSLVGSGPFKFGNPYQITKTGSDAVASAVYNTNPILGYPIGYVRSGVGGIKQEVAISNMAGVFITPSSRLVDTYSYLPNPLPSPGTSWAGVLIFDINAKYAYPIVAFVYGFTKRDYRGRPLGKFVVPFLRYVFSAAGQAVVVSQNFYKLHPNIIASNLAGLKSISY